MNLRLLLLLSFIKGDAGRCWAMKVTNKRKIATTEMRMLRGILGVSRRDHMRNEEIRRILHLSPIDEVMRSGRLRWFGHVQRQDATNVTRRVMALAIPGARRRGRPKKTWHQQMKEDMAGVGVTQDVALDRKEWSSVLASDTLQCYCNVISENCNVFFNLK